MPSVRQLAKQLGLSVATVSRALNNSPSVKAATRKRVQAAANAARYAPSVGRRSTTTLGLVYFSAPLPQSHGAYEANMMHGVLQGLNEQRFDLIVLNLQRDRSPDESYTQFFMRKGVRGVFLRPLSAGRSDCEQIAAEGFPHIVLAEHYETPKVNFICGDSRSDSRRAVQHLIDLGHRRIALCIHSIPDEDHMDREQGYREAHEASKLTLEPEYLVRVNADLAGGAQALTRLLSGKTPPTAIYCADPALTLGLLRRAHELALRIPDEFSVIGFDDGDLRHTVYPTYTSVCQVASNMGYEAAQWLSRSLTGQAEPAFRKRITTSFEINGTTTRVPEQTVRFLPNGKRFNPTV